MSTKMDLENINPDWTYLLKKLHWLQRKSNCRRMKVAAIDINTYIGFPNKGIACSAKPGICGCYHAEQILIGKSPSKVKEILVSHSPCYNCAEILYAQGIVAIFFLEEYREKAGIEYLVQRGIKCIRI